MSSVLEGNGREPYEIFLSVHNPDAPLAVQLFDKLAAEGYRVFFYQKSNTPGDTWQDSIERALTEVHTFLVLLTDSAPAGWTAAEVRAAQRRQMADPEGFRIIPVLAMENGVAPKSLGVFLDDAHRCELHVHEQKVEPDDLARLLDTLRDTSPGPTKFRIVDEPYRGLEVYRTEDQLLFCGRDRETSELIDELRDNRWIQVEGGSGSGKSSLVRAGLMPALSRRLRDAHDGDWMFLTMRPGGNPVKELAAALLDLEPDNRDVGRLTDVEQKLWRSPDALANIVREWNTLYQRERPRPVLLFVDQFEELFTQGGSSPSTNSSPPDRSLRNGNESTGESNASKAKAPATSSRDQFAALLEAALADKNGPLNLVTTIRSDFLLLVTQHAVLSQKLNYAKRYVLGPIASSELRRCILDPLRMAGGRDASEELVKRLIEDTEAGPGRLPLLSHALRSLWHAARRRGDHTPTLRFEDYEAIGGVGGAVTRSADVLLHSLTPAQQHAARRMFLELVQPGRGVRDVRKSATREALIAAGGPEAEGVLLQLSGGAKPGASAPALPRLLVADQSAALPGHPEMVDLIHDSLVDRWGTLRGWLDEARRDLERRIDLEAAATAWANAGSLTSDVPSPGLTAYYTKWDGDPPAISATAQKYLDAALHHHRSKRLWERATLAAAATAAIVFAALFLWAMKQRASAINARNEAEALRGQALQTNGRLAMERGVSFCEQQEPRRGILWLARALEVATEANDENLQRSIRLLLAGWDPPFHNLIANFEPLEAVATAAFSPDGRKILTGNWDKSAQLWSAESPLPIGRAMPHQESVTVVAFSHDSAMALTGSDDGAVRLWKTTDGTPAGEPLEHKSKVTSATFGPDGNAVLVGYADGAAFVWDIASGEAAWTRKHPSPVEGVAWSFDGKTMLTQDQPGFSDDLAANTHLWDAASRDPIGDTAPSTALVGEMDKLAYWGRAPVFSPNSQLAATANGKTARIWDVVTGKTIGADLVHDSTVRTVAFSPDSELVVTGGDDQSVKVWDAATGRLVAKPIKSKYEVMAVAFSPDGRLILSAGGFELGNVGEVRLWDASSGAPVGVPLQLSHTVVAAAFSPDGKTILTCGADGTASLWRIGLTSNNRLTKSFRNDINKLYFTPDGKTIVAQDSHDFVRLVDAMTGQAVNNPFHPPRVMYGLDEQPNEIENPFVTLSSQMVFSPDGKRALSHGETEGLGLLWDTRTGTPVGEPIKHEREINCGDFSPNGEILLTGGSDGVVRLWDAQAATPLSEPLQQPGPVAFVSFTRDGSKFLVASLERANADADADGDGDADLVVIARLWDTAERKPVSNPFQLDEDAVFLSPNGKVIITANDFEESAQLWDIASGRRIGEPLRHQQSIYVIEFSNDGKVVLTAGEDGARLWEVATAKPIGEPLQPGELVTSAAFSPDGKTLLTGCPDGAVRLWEIATGRALAAPYRSKGYITAVSFRPDGKAFAVGSGVEDENEDILIQRRGEIRLWDVPRPMKGDAIQVMAWATANTGLEFNSSDAIVELNDRTQLQRLKELK